MKPKWFSAKLRFLCLIEGRGVHSAMHSIFLVRAPDFDLAQARVLEVGKSAEKEYLNQSGEKVAWKLQKVLTLDILDDHLDGAEVHSEILDADPDEASFETIFSPENSVPDQTL